jgi:hypothetical protein
VSRLLRKRDTYAQFTFRHFDDQSKPRSRASPPRNT